MDQGGICVASLAKVTLLGQPSCIAFPPEHHDLFVIGTYQLDQTSKPDTEGELSTGQDNIQSQSRSGTVQLFRLEENKQVTLLQTHDLTSTLSHETPHSRSPGAVLDLRFSPSSLLQDIFAICTSTGQIILFKIYILEKPSQAHPTLELIHVFQPFPAETLLTSLSWNPNPQSEDEAELAITLSDGRIAVLSPLLSTEPKIQSIHPLHSESAWTTQWMIPATSSQSQQRILATGGDDATIHLLTLPHPTESANPEDIEAVEEEIAQHAIDIHSHTTPSATHLYDDRSHSAGVTSILSLTPEVLATGSYDNVLRILRPRPFARKWETLAEADLGGGVWKLDLLACENTGKDVHWLVLASCMHAGARIVQISCRKGGGWEVRVLARFTEHGSMCYASCAVASGSRNWVVVSTSFYDRMLCVWDFAWDRHVS